MNKPTTQDKINLMSQDAKLGLIDVQSVNVGGQMVTVNAGYIIVTRKLAGENWVEFDSGELIVFKDGSIVYPLNRQDTS
jgi:hypothetical protein